MIYVYLMQQPPTAPSGGARAARPSQPPAQQGRGGPPRPQQPGNRPPAPGGQQPQQAMRMMPAGCNRVPCCSRAQPLLMSSPPFSSVQVACHAANPTQVSLHCA